MISRSALAAFTAALVAVLLLGPAQAQSILQSGPTISGHVPMYQLGPGQGFAAVMDSGFASGLSAAGTQTGAGINELLQVNHSAGVGPFGSHVSFLDGPASGGWHALSFDADALGGGLITYNAFGTAGALPLQICANGQCVQFPFVTTGVLGPSSSTVGDLACWNNTVGTLLRDCGPQIPPQNCPNIAAYGGAGDNATDNSGPLATAIAAQPGSFCVSFSVGKYKFLSTVTHSNPGAYTAAALQGAGSNVTELIGPGGNSFFSLIENGQFNSFHFSGFSSETPSACASCTAISVTQAASTTSEGYTPQSDFVDVSFYGTDRDLGSSANYWGTGIYLNGVSNVTFDRVYEQGLSANPTAATNGIFVDTTSANTPVIFNLHSVTLNNILNGLSINAKVQGVFVSQSNFVNDKYCIYDPSAAGVGSQMTVTDSAFACNYGVFLGAGWGGIQIANNQFEIGLVGPDTNRYGIIVGPTAQYSTITGNVFSGTTTTNTIGIALADTANSGILTGNELSNLGVGVAINPGATGWVINPNHYVNNTFNIASNQAFGNVINNEVTGAVPVLSGGCGTGAAFSSGATDERGQIEVGTSPGTSCTVTFSKAFINFPICSAWNSSSLVRSAAALFVTQTSMQIASAGALGATDFLQYHCDGYQ